MIPFHKAVREKQLSLGIIYLWNSSEMFPIFAKAGFNHVMLDHMFTAMDWGTTANLITSARTAGLAPLIRVQTYPWAGGAPDMTVVSHVARARALGAAGAVISVSSVEQVEGLMHINEDTGHLPGIGGPQAAEKYFAGGWDAVRAAIAEDVLDFPIVPFLEDTEHIEFVEDIARIDGVGVIGLGIHDLCQAVGHPFDVDHPDVMAVIDRVVAAARPRGISVLANTGYIYSRADEIVPRIQRLYERGVDVVHVQTPGQLIYPPLADIAQGAYKLIAPEVLETGGVASGPRGGLD